MKLIIDIHNKIVKISLTEKEKRIDFFIFPEENNLSDRLLLEIDNLLQKNKLFSKDIEKAELKTDLTDGFTTYRIAKTIVDTFNWGKAVASGE